FPYPKNNNVKEPRPIKQRSLCNTLNDLSVECNICTTSGQNWHFTGHQFRHTVGTSMINSGVPQHIVQRYLGHESPEMTMVYAHIHDKTLRKEIEKYHESKVVNFQGETAELDETVLSSNDDLEWFKKNVQARALEHGYCARPRVLGDCDIPGFDGCYNCPHWRTNKNFIPILKDTLERTNNVLKKAQGCGWQLQVHKNTPIKENLEKVIKTLEADND
ncbi:MAG: tyrosine-type recombinase/integrase, partial [Nostoc sp.]